MPSPLLQIDNLSKAVGDKLLFANVSFSISEGQRIALIARNGVGKSTLLNIITGKTDYDSGLITNRKDLRIGYLEQQPHFQSHLTVWQIVEQAEERLRQEHEDTVAFEVRAKQILSRLLISDLNQPIEQLSGGQQKRVALALVLLTEPELLILDEPTNHLDLKMVEWLEEFLQRNVRTLLMVTHDRYFLDRVCSDILELDQQQLFSYHGNYSYFLNKRAERIEQQNAETERYRNLYRTELEWIRRMPQARGHKAQYRVDRFDEIEQKAQRKIEDHNLNLTIKETYIGSKIFEAKHVSKTFHNDLTGNDTRILSDFSYIFSRYEKLGIIGGNGVGKSTFIRLLLGYETPDLGHFDIGTTIRFGYFSQAGLIADEGKKVIDVVRDKAEYIEMGGGRKMSASQFLQHFLFSPQQQYDYVDKLSGGERQRLHLCSVLMQNPNFLILDEPTNDLDIQSLNVLEEYLRQFKGCLIVVSHDRYFMDKIVDHLFVFHGDANIQDFAGNYTQYRESERLKEKEREQQPSSKEQGREQKSSSKEQGRDRQPPSDTSASAKPHLNDNLKPRFNDLQKPRRLTYKEQQELKDTELAIERLTEEKAAIEQFLSIGNTDINKIRQMSERYEQVKQELDDREMRWLELNE